jgi:hypothetical protein
MPGEGQRSGLARAPARNSSFDIRVGLDDKGHSFAHAVARRGPSHLVGKELK